MDCSPPGSSVYGILQTRILEWVNISWQIEREAVQTVTDLILWSSKVIADGDCSHEIKRCLPLGRKAMSNLDSILQCRDITLPANVPLVNAIVFPVVTYGYGC